jgi:hypothetical protein
MKNGLCPMCNSTSAFKNTTGEEFGDLGGGDSPIIFRTSLANYEIGEDYKMKISEVLKTSEVIWLL